MPGLGGLARAGGKAASGAAKGASKAASSAGRTVKGASQSVSKNVNRGAQGADNAAAPTIDMSAIEADINKKFASEQAEIDKERKLSEAASFIPGEGTAVSMVAGADADKKEEKLEEEKAEAETKAAEAQQKAAEKEARSAQAQQKGSQPPNQPANPAGQSGGPSNMSGGLIFFFVALIIHLLDIFVTNSDRSRGLVNIPVLGGYAALFIWYMLTAMKGSAGQEKGAVIGVFIAGYLWPLITLLDFNQSLSNFASLFVLILPPIPIYLMLKYSGESKGLRYLMVGYIIFFFVMSFNILSPFMNLPGINTNVDIAGATDAATGGISSGTDEFFKSFCLARPELKNSKVNLGLTTIDCKKYFEDDALGTGTQTEIAKISKAEFDTRIDADDTLEGRTVNYDNNFHITNNLKEGVPIDFSCALSTNKAFTSDNKWLNLVGINSDEVRKGTMSPMRIENVKDKTIRLLCQIPTQVGDYEKQFKKVVFNANIAQVRTTANLEKYIIDATPYDGLGTLQGQLKVLQQNQGQWGISPTGGISESNEFFKLVISIEDKNPLIPIYPDQSVPLILRTHIENPAQGVFTVFRELEVNIPQGFKPTEQCLAWEAVENPTGTTLRYKVQELGKIAEQAFRQKSEKLTKFDPCPLTFDKSVEISQTPRKITFTANIEYDFLIEKTYAMTLIKAEETTAPGGTA